MTIFDLMQSQELAAYWIELTQDEAPYPTEELFPDDKKRGISLQWLRGAKGLPIVLKTSAFDVHAIPRGRIGFEKLTAEMPYFKESMYIDEELRQELNMVLETGNQEYIDSVMDKIFDDETRLLRGAKASRERMRTMALTTGVVSMAANGQSFTYDYGVTHKATVSKSWEDPDSDPIADIKEAIDKVEADTGCTITRAMCDGKTWRNLKKNTAILKAIFVQTNGVGHLTDAALETYLKDQLDGLTIRRNKYRYKDENGKTLPFMPADTFVMFPDGPLGKTWFGTTPAESDLMAGNAADVSIVDTGVAVTMKSEIDPVQVQTIVSMICLPSFEAADEVYILDTKAKQN